VLIGTMFSNFIGNGYNFLSEIPLKKYFYCKQTTRKCEILFVHYTITTSNKELCTKSISHLGVYNLVLVKGNMNNFLSGVPVKFEIFYSVEYHLIPHFRFDIC